MSFDDVTEDVINSKDVYVLFFQVLNQANANHASVKAIGGSCHVPTSPEDVVIDLRYINRLLGLDVNNRT